MATIGGKWVGLGLGDASEEVGKIRDFMRRKFARYAGDLPDTRTAAGVPLFDEPMAAATLIMQSAYADEGRLKRELVNGYIGASTKVVMGYLSATEVDIRPMLFTVGGTGVPWWIGPDADLARALESSYKWQPVGYPAAPFPMGKSISAGKERLRLDMEAHRAQIERNGFAMAAFSQGAIVIGEVWEEDIKPVNGRLHWAYRHFLKAVTWGNPMREIGRAWPDPGAPVASPTSGGVTPRLMVDTPDSWRDYAHQGDFYTEVEPDQAAENKRAVWAIIRGQDVFKGPDSILAQVLEVLGVRKDARLLFEAIGIVRALLDTGMFFVVRRTTPHLNYDIRPAIDFLRW